MHAGGSEEFDAVAKFCCDEKVKEFYAANALEDEVFEADGGTKGEANEDGEFLCGIDTVDVHSWVGFGVAALLSFEKHIFVGLPLIKHSAEDEVAGAIEDGFERENAVSGEGRVDGGDDRDATGDSGFEGNRAAGGAGGVEKFITMLVEECLVGGDDVLTGMQELEDSGASRLDATDDVNYGLDFRVADYGLKIAANGDAFKTDCPGATGVADNYAFEINWPASLSGNQIARGIEDLDDSGADGAASDECNIKWFWGSHVLWSGCDEMALKMRWRRFGSWQLSNFQGYPFLAV